MNMPEGSEHFDGTCTHAERPAVAAWSQNRRRCSAICSQPLAPSHTPRVSHSPKASGEGPASVPQARCGATYFGGAWAGSPRLKASATHSARSCGSCINCSGRSIPRRGELGDELKKPLQALREAGRAKPRWIFAVTFFRLQPKPDFRIQCLAARNAASVLQSATMVPTLHCRGTLISLRERSWSHPFRAGDSRKERSCKTCRVQKERPDITK